MRIELAPYDELWTERFTKTAEQLWAVLGDVEDARRRYETVKRELAERDWDRVDDYADAKGDCIWQLLREADRWSSQTGDQV